MKTKPFDLQKALAGHPVVAKNGKKALQIAHFPAAPLSMFRLAVLLEGENYPLSYSEEGKKYSNSDVGGYDLLLEVKTVKKWGRVCLGDSGAIHFSGSFGTKEEAENPAVYWDNLKILPAYEYEVEE